MNQFTITFFGHRYIDEPFKIKELLEEYIRELLKNKEYIEFIVGRNGEFDCLVAGTIKKLKNNYRDDNSALVLVLPYNTAEYSNNKKSFEEYYDEVYISDSASKAYPKRAIEIRNKELIDKADLIICYIKESFGGADKAVKYAKKQNKEVINLALML